MLGASDALGQYRFAGEDTKEARPYTCVDCGQAVHLVRRPEYALFFRHNRKGGCGGEGALHKAVIALLTSGLKLCVPRHSTIQPDCDEAIVEFVVKRQDRLIAKGDVRRPDLVVDGVTGRFAIEVSVSNPLSKERREWFLDRGLPCLQIDVREEQATTEIALAHFLVTRSDGRDWVCDLPGSSEPAPLIVAITAAPRANVLLKQPRTQTPEISRPDPSSFWRSPRFSLEREAPSRPGTPRWEHYLAVTLELASAPSAISRPYPADLFIQDREHVRRTLLASGLSPTDAEQTAMAHAENMKREWEFAYGCCRPTYEAAQAHAGRFGDDALEYPGSHPRRTRPLPSEIASARQRAR